MRRMISPILALVLILTAAAVCAADWPIFRGPNGDGISTETGINKDWNNKPPRMLWQVDMNDGGYAGPSAAAGKVFIIDHKGENDIVRAHDVNTGKVVWQYVYPDREKEVYGWSHSTPTYNSGRVYAQGRQGLLNCLDARTGKKLWSRDLLTEFKGKKPAHFYTWSPFVDGNKVIVCPGGPDASVVALDKTTGRAIWQGGGSDEAGYATPRKVTINGKAQYVIFSATSIMGVDPDTGKRIWSQKWKTDYGINVAAPVVIGNSVFITSSYGHGCALVDITVDGARLRWENKEMLAHFSSPILVNDYIYGNGDPDHLICLDPQTGIAKWKKEGFEKGPLAGVDGVLMAFEGKTGALVMIDPIPHAYTEIGRFTPLGGQSWNMPVIANGKLIVRNTKKLACFDLR